MLVNWLVAVWVATKPRISAVALVKERFHFSFTVLLYVGSRFNGDSMTTGPCAANCRKITLGSCSGRLDTFLSYLECHRHLVSSTSGTLSPTSITGSCYFWLLLPAPSSAQSSSSGSTALC